MGIIGIFCALRWELHLGLLKTLLWTANGACTSFAMLIEHASLMLKLS